MGRYADINALSILAENIKDTLIIKDKTEAQAIAAASTYPNNIYYTSDTHNIVVNGSIFGRSSQITTSAFAFASDTSAISSWDTSKIYLVPTATSGVLSVYIYEDNSWQIPGTIDLTPATNAEDISYDLTQTPELGTGNVQSAIEALDGKVEAVDARIDDEKVEFIKHMPLGDISYNGITFYRQTAITYSDANGIITFSAATGSGNTTYGLRWSYNIIPKGTVVRVKFTRTETQWFLIAYSTDSPQDYHTEHGTIVGFTAKRLLSSTAKEINYVGIMPEDGYLLIRDYAAAESERTPGIQINLYSLDMLTKMYDYKFDFIKEWMPYGGDVSSVYGQTNRNNSNNRISADGLEMVSAGTTNCSYTLKQIPKGSLLHFTGIYNSNTTFATIFRVSYVKESPSEYYSEHGNTLVGMKLDGVLYSTLRANSVNEWFIMPETAYVIWNGVYAYSNNMHLYVYPSGPFKEWYSKGLKDGSGMASIAGLGYNVYDYISGAVNLAGFEYGCGLYRNSQALSGACADKYKNNTKLVYFPKFDMSGVTTWDSIFAGCTALQIVPDLNVASPTGSYQFNGCTNLLEVGDIGSESGTIACYYMFQNCTHLRRVGSIHAKISGTTGRMFYSTSALTHIESINFSLQTTVYTNTGNQTFTSTSNLRYVVLKYLGTPSNCTALNFSLITNWGVATTAEPDARQSLIDTLITYSFDRVTAGYSTCTITLSANTKALLTTEELEQITAKGYTIA